MVDNNLYRKDIGTKELDDEKARAFEYPVLELNLEVLVVDRIY